MLLAQIFTRTVYAQNIYEGGILIWIISYYLPVSRMIDDHIYNFVPFTSVIQFFPLNPFLFPLLIGWIDMVSA